MMPPATLALRYAAFAVIATLVNLATQRGVLAAFGGPAGYALALGVGTAVGLVAKFALDKRWIFLDPSEGARSEARKFSLYTLTGVVTTLVFWGSETLFWVIGKADVMRELGAVLGLTIGYTVKYRLDRRFVFRSALRRPEG